MTYLTPLSLVPDACDTLIMVGPRADTRQMLAQLTAFFGAEISIYAPEFAGEPFKAPAPTFKDSLLVLDRMEEWDLTSPGALVAWGELLQSKQALCPVMLPGVDLGPLLARPHRNLVTLTVGIPPGRLILTGKSFRLERAWPGELVEG